MTEKKKGPLKKRGRKKGTKLTDAQKAAGVRQGTGRGEVCPKCGNIIPGHKLTCVLLQLPPKKKRA